MIYLQTIFKRPKGELIINIYEAMKKESHQRDWYQLIVNDFENFNLHISDNLFETMNE